MNDLTDHLLAMGLIGTFMLGIMVLGRYYPQLGVFIIAGLWTLALWGWIADARRASRQTRLDEFID